MPNSTGEEPDNDRYLQWFIVIVGMFIPAIIVVSYIGGAIAAIICAIVLLILVFCLASLLKIRAEDLAKLVSELKKLFGKGPQSS